MTPETTEIVDGLVRFARTLTTGKVGHLGISRGGYFSAHSGLTQVVDAAVVVGGPITSEFSSDNLGRLLHGMKDIFGNAAGFTSPPPTSSSPRQAPGSPWTTCRRKAPTARCS
jgi:esterase FrsA